MGAVKNLFDKQWKIKLFLFVVSFLIYFFHFQEIFLHLNTLLSSITSDAVKNYFTYLYHIKHDQSLLHFEGMAYPYGEHVVYADCQPLLTFILRLLPFTHHYLIGILHGLIYLSFIVSPVLLYDSFIKFRTTPFTAFFAALAIAMLSPQFLKINAGHFGLAHGAMIPFAIYLLALYFEKNKTSVLALLAVYISALFLIHPYMGFSIAVFCFISLFCLFLFRGQWRNHWRSSLIAIMATTLPIVLFKLFMLVTDRHPNRTNEPFGLDGMVENIDSILSPVFGPMQPFMEKWFNARTMHYEGHSYLGFFSIMMIVAFVLAFMFNIRKTQIQKSLLAMLVAAFVLLMISFGWHQKLMSMLGLDLAFMNQFRATCRFAWFFYYVLPVFLVVHFDAYFSAFKENKSARVLSFIFPFTFFIFNLTESHAMFKMDANVFWKFRNIFLEDQFNAEEKSTLAIIESKKIQAIVPLPLYHSGTEMFDRKGFNNSMIPSMIYACASGVPIYSAMMSRTSMSETKDGLNLMNGYLRDKPAVKKLGAADFLVLQTEKELMPDEWRLMQAAHVFQKNDSITFGFISKSDFLKPKLKGWQVIYDDYKKIDNDSNHVTFIPMEEREPYTIGHMDKFSSLYVLDSNKINSGDYVVSVKYHYSLNNFHALACDMIITENCQGNFIWKYMIPIRYLSGFYPGYAVFEHQIQLEKNKKYEFLISGREKQTYSISDFMLRPADLNVLVIKQSKDTLFNNYSTQ